MSQYLIWYREDAKLVERINKKENANSQEERTQVLKPTTKFYNLEQVLHSLKYEKEVEPSDSTNILFF